MALPLIPIIAIAALAMFAGGAVKRKRKRKVRGQLGPIPGAGEPIRDAPPAEIRDEAPLYPFESLTEVQEALAFVGVDPGIPDGKWGSDTSDALREFQASPECPGCTSSGSADQMSLQHLEAAAAKRYMQVGECDPLMQDCPFGEACFAVDDQFLCLPEAMDVSATAADAEAIERVGGSAAGGQLGPGGFREIVVSPDFTQVHIGGGWVLGVLDPWLREQQEAGKLVMLNSWSKTLSDILWNDPANFWLVPLKDSLGGANEWPEGRPPRFNEVADALFSEMTDPAARRIIAAADDGKVRLAAEYILQGVGIAAVGSLVAGGLVAFGSVPAAAITVAFWSVAGGTAGVLDASHELALKETAAWAATKFGAVGTAKVGTRSVRIAEIPLLSVAGLKIASTIGRYIKRFQQMEIG